MEARRETQKYNPSLTQRVGIVTNSQLQKANAGTPVACTHEQPTMSFSLRLTSSINNSKLPGDVAAMTS